MPSRQITWNGIRRIGFDDIDVGRGLTGGKVGWVGGAVIAGVDVGLVPILVVEGDPADQGHRGDNGIEDGGDDGHAVGDADDDGHT